MFQSGGERDGVSIDNKQSSCASTIAQPYGFPRLDPLSRLCRCYEREEPVRTRSAGCSMQDAQMQVSPEKQ